MNKNAVAALALLITLHVFGGVMSKMDDCGFWDGVLMVTGVLCFVAFLMFLVFEMVTP